MAIELLGEIHSKVILPLGVLAVEVAELSLVVLVGNLHLHGLERVVLHELDLHV